MLLALLALLLFSAGWLFRPASCQPNFANLQASIDDSLDLFDIVGITASITFRDESSAPIHAVAGLSRLDPDTILTPLDNYHWASNSKVFTAAAVFRLIDDGRLSLDDRMADYLPTEICARFEYCHNITIRHLISMRSGLSNENPPGNRWTQPWTPYQLLIGIPQTTNFFPGEGFQYNNNNFWILGFIVEVITQQRAQDFIKEQIVPPLATSFIMPATREEYDVMYGYERIGPATVELHKVLHPSYIYTSGSAVATASDESLWLAELFGRRSVVSNASLAQMQVKYTDDEDDNFYGHGLMFVHEFIGVADQLVIWGHNGGLPGFDSMAGYVEGYEFALAIGINMSGTSDMNDLFVKTLIDIGVYQPPSPAATSRIHFVDFD